MNQLDEPTKNCPFCGEQILAVAVKCKHCQSVLGELPAGIVTPPLAPPLKPSAGDGTGILLALIPWIGVALCWFWVGESPLLTASSNLTTVAAVIVISSAIIAAMDASALGFGAKGGPAEKASSPIGTFIAMVLLWIIFYPMHMKERAKHGRPNRTAIAVIGALLYCASAIYLYVLIDDKLTQLREVWNR